jgi:hypothetical protein
VEPRPFWCAGQRNQIACMKNMNLRICTQSLGFAETICTWVEVFFPVDFPLTNPPISGESTGNVVWCPVFCGPLILITNPRSSMPRSRITIIVEDYCDTLHQIAWTLKVSVRKTYIDCHELRESKRRPRCRCLIEGMRFMDLLRSLWIFYI